METLLIAFEAVIPLFIYIFIGLLIKKAKLLTSIELKHVNSVVFKVFLSSAMFYNIYASKTNFSEHLNVVIFAFSAIISVFIISTILSFIFIKDNKERGAMVQAAYRSNFVILGLPLAANIFGDDNIGITTMLLSGTIPIYNILAVLLLETLRGSSFSLKKVILNLFKNPMIIGAILAFMCVLLSIQLPTFIVKPINQIRIAATPLALIVLGASFSLENNPHKLKLLSISITSRLLIVPAIVLSLAYYFGFRGIEFISLLGIFATPAAVSSFAMAQQLDSDSELTGDTVIYSSALSCFTIFIWLVFFKTINAF